MAETANDCTGERMPVNAAGLFRSGSGNGSLRACGKGAGAGEYLTGELPVVNPPVMPCYGQLITAGSGPVASLAGRAGSALLQQFGFCPTRQGDM